MPVVNPANPNEMDYVDKSLVSKIVFEPEYLHYFREGKQHRVSLQLNPHPDSAEKILFSAALPDGKERHVDIDLQAFEETLSHIIHHDNSKRLEQTELFRSAINHLITGFIADQKKINNLYARTGELYDLYKGLGVIHDTKAEQDVGTFESFSFQITRSDKRFSVVDAFLSGRTSKEVAEDPSRFVFTYYNLNDNLIYTLIPKGSAGVQQAKVGECNFEYANMEIYLEPFSTDHSKYELIAKAEEAKSMMDHADPEDPLYQEEYEKFRGTRLEIISTSRELAKKQKLVSMFADIEL
jgi:hypothetical protein